MPIDDDLPEFSGVVLRSPNTQKTRENLDPIRQQQVIAYTRCSTQDQDNDRNSNQKQRERIEAYCKAQHFDLIKTLGEVESAAPASIERRVELMNALVHAETYGVPLLVTEINRLARHPASIDEIYSYQVPIISTKLGRPVGIVEARRLAKEAQGVLRGLHQASRSGIRNLPDPSVAGKASGEARNRLSVVFHDKVLEQIVRIYGDREPLDEKEIAQELNARGVPASRGGKWSEQQVKRTFKVLEEAQADHITSSPAGAAGNHLVDGHDEE